MKTKTTEFGDYADGGAVLPPTRLALKVGEVEVAEEFIANALCAAFEGGIGYWAHTVGKSCPGEPAKPWGDGYTPSYVSYPLTEGAAIVLGADGADPQPLTLAGIHRALALMVQNYPRHFADLVADDGDATTGDVLVQLAVFGELVFC